MTTCPGCGEIIRATAGLVDRHKRYTEQGTPLTCLYSGVPLCYLPIEPKEPEPWQELKSYAPR